MRLAWELPNTGSVITPAVTSLCWTSLPGDDDHGLLATGTAGGVVGITLTDIHPPVNQNARHNYNLRGHHHPISIVAWNRSKGRLASADTNGTIYVWVKNEERWSVELVNERGVKVRDVHWAPDGSCALIVYEDNFVLIGSASGQRVWSSTFPAANVLCGVWATTRRIVVGLSSGAIQILSDDGTAISDRHICSDEIKRISAAGGTGEKIAMLTTTGKVMILQHLDQIDPDVFEDDLVTLIEWSPCGKYLAAITAIGEIYILDSLARLIHRDEVQQVLETHQKVTGFTWMHGGRALAVALGTRIYVARVFAPVPTLFNIVAHKVWCMARGDTSKVASLEIPAHEKVAINEFNHHIIRCRIPSPTGMKDFVNGCWDQRTYCTISTANKHFSLCMEHMGGVVPILTGRQASRIVPSFHISLHPLSSDNTPKVSAIAGRFAQVDDSGTGLNRASRSATQRMSLWRRSKRRIQKVVSRRVLPPCDEQDKMAMVQSNVCCTRFNVMSSNEDSPTMLANVSYKTSLLHLQPRQMTVKLRECKESTEDDSVDGMLCHVSARCDELSEAIGEEEKAVEEERPEIEEEGTSHASSWHEEVEALDYIDDGVDEEPLVPQRKKGVVPFGKNNKSQPATLPLQSSSSSRPTNTAKNNPQADENALKGIRKELLELKKKVDEIERKAAAGPAVKKDLQNVTKRLHNMKESLDGKHVPNVYTLKNKTPFWNETNQVYQLDFGGRVTQESAKNFQIELDSTQCLQFGRVDGGCYTLDFKAPFSAIQAFAIALASITQRLK